MKHRKKSGKIRIIKKIHRISGLYFVIFILILAISGLLLAWKKDSGGILSIPTFQGSTMAIDGWLPLEDLTQIASDFYIESFPGKQGIPERIEIRPDKGILKFLFTNYYEIQIDGANGEVLHTGYRISDIVESIHDGSIIDKAFGSNSRIAKIIYSSLMALASMTFALSGVWIWYRRRRG